MALTMCYVVLGREHRTELNVVKKDIQEIKTMLAQLMQK